MKLATFEHNGHVLTGVAVGQDLLLDLDSAARPTDRPDIPRERAREHIYGCGFESGRYLEPGDVVELEIELLGTLRNVVGPYRGPPGERPRG